MNKKILIGSIIAVAILVLMSFTGVVGSQSVKSNYFFNKINNMPPVADADGPYFSNINEEILFNGSGSYDPDGVIVSYEWDFGDGFTGSGENATHIYYNPNIYTVILTVTDDDGAIDNDTTLAYINSPPERPMIDGPTSGKIEVEYNYTFVSSDLEGDEIFYWIEWGDGNDTGWIGPYDSGEKITRSHSWDENGTYEIRAKAKDFWCESYWSFLFVSIGNHAPEAPDIDGPTRGKLGVEYNFTFKAIDPDRDVLCYFIDWGDNNSEWTFYYESGEEVVVSHTWSEKGAFTIRAKAKDIYGAESEWGTLEVTMPKNKQSQNVRLLRFLERFPLLQRLLVVLGWYAG